MNSNNRLKTLSNDTTAMLSTVNNINKDQTEAVPSSYSLESSNESLDSQLNSNEEAENMQVGSSYEKTLVKALVFVQYSDSSEKRCFCIF